MSESFAFNRHFFVFSPFPKNSFNHSNTISFCLRIRQKNHVPFFFHWNDEVSERFFLLVRFPIPPKKRNFFSRYFPRPLSAATLSACMYVCLFFRVPSLKRIERDSKEKYPSLFLSLSTLHLPPRQQPAALLLYLCVIRTGNVLFFLSSYISLFFFS